VSKVNRDRRDRCHSCQVLTDMTGVMSDKEVSQITEYSGFYIKIRSVYRFSGNNFLIHNNQ